MPTILLSKADEVYLQKCAVELSFAYGIIIGQRAEPEKYVVVHLAKNSEEDVELPTLPAGTTDEEAAAHGPQSVEDIDTQALTNQWISASKMIPGSFVVLGVFVAGVSAELVTEHSFKNAKNLLYDVHNLLIQGYNYCGTIDDVAHSDYLYLAYSTAAKQAVCQSYTHSTNGGALSPMECRFVEKSFEWHPFECSYEFDDVFPILETRTKINIEDQFQRTIAAVRRYLAVSEIFIQSESVDDGQLVDTYLKRGKTNRKGKAEVAQQHQQQQQQAIRATIFLPLKCQLSQDNPVKVSEFNGTIRFAGMISSRIWCNPKNTLGDVKRFLRDDILRSLAARIQVYCDGLTDPNISTEALFISEPPRRVYFSLPADANANPVQFSEYIFRGEAPTVAVAQAKQILDLEISSEHILADLEALPDDDTFSDSSSDTMTNASQFQAHSSRDLTKTIYMLGIAVALLVLLVSVLMHYVIGP